MVIYIKELDKNDKLGNLDKFPKFIQKIIIKFTEKTNNFFIVNIDEKNQKFILPNINKKKVFEKIRREIKKRREKSRKKVEIVLCNNLHGYLEKFRGLKVLDGKQIYLKHIEEIIKNILGENPIEMQDIYILANTYSKSNVNLIRELAVKARGINVITNDIKKYSTLEGLMLEKGIAITISNNKRKSLKKAKLIVNLDFDVDLLRRYNIYRSACIINLSSSIIDSLQCFDGIVINSIDVKLPNEQYQIMKANNLITNFKNIELYESLDIDNSNIEILKLYGNNGKIHEKERLNVQNILTN